MSVLTPVLSIAGSDCSGGAGIQADLKTMSANGCFAMSVITSVVAENTARVISVLDVDPKIIADQIDAVFEDIRPKAVKIGMLDNPDIMQVVADKLVEYQAENVVIDPVMYAKNGAPLMDPNCIDSLIRIVIPHADVLTPNIPEAECISGLKITDLEGQKAAAKAIQEMGCTSALVKGGHATGDAIDVLYDGKNFYEFSAKRINTKNTHGTGCTYSSAIAANLALGHPFHEAIDRAKKYVTMAIEHSLELGNGNGPTNHFWDLYAHGLAGFDANA
ncbi:phosphomethylpyrimidine kinase [Bifidobacterium sp. UTCIF-39]|uniref:bifunctional hydroxymethylpyrimidine kinase/phosphomethylpyrimidine kinase n=1 Tax=Bifidobacterium sp. UTCIF-39 TaxID=1465359 RepID=UPI001C6124D5|nr:bifunctional hydroxymethylpyrimidine kinase/phosphomethylpyrimidine kinase [Bifidobacterium sp. UTCIF-39]TPF97248.1 phosphomethylpyrimidine kinase [Bifidobacterium sp. UTCIF-39]